MYNGVNREWQSSLQGEDQYIANIRDNETLGDSFLILNDSNECTVQQELVLNFTKDKK
jgi:hypothetical protein